MMAARHIKPEEEKEEEEEEKWRHSLTPNCPAWFLITPELLHYIYQELYVVCKSNTFVHVDFSRLKLKNVGNTLQV